VAAVIAAWVAASIDAATAASVAARMEASTAALVAASTAGDADRSRLAALRVQDDDPSARDVDPPGGREPDEFGTGQAEPQLRGRAELPVGAHREQEEILAKRLHTVTIARAAGPGKAPARRPGLPLLEHVSVLVRVGSRWP
jgi:hypothetical protein